MNPPPIRRHSEMLEAHLPSAGLLIADIGCGDGAVARLLAERGGRVVGLDPSPAQIARARAAEAVAGEDYLVGCAEALPFADATLDAALFFNALHHVPVALQARALAEARRAIKAGGRLCIVEPIAEGPHFTLTRAIDDETEVRARAYEAMQAALAEGAFDERAEITYWTRITYPDFAAFKAKMVAVDETRRATVESLEAQLRDSFEAVAAREGTRYVLTQPCRLNLFSRPQ
jgi:SAM-dependent methyltransferase